jgi:phage gp36-like protein
MARYKLVGADVTETDIVRTRYKDAIKALESIRDGKLDIGLSEAGQAPVAAASIQASAPERVFSSSALEGF